MAAAPEQKSIPYLSRGEFVAFVCLLLFTMIVNAKGGADWPQYLDWQHYFLSFDLSALARYPKSLRGLPLVQWQYGAGLLSAMLHLVFRYPHSLQSMAAFLGVANLLLFTYVARNYSKQWSLLSSLSGVAASFHTGRLLSQCIFVRRLDHSFNTLRTLVHRMESRPTPFVLLLRIYAGRDLLFLIAR